MLLSIIIPVYNGEKVIERCLNSILNKNKSKEFEVLVINDGSKDNTYGIIEKLAKEDERLKIYNNENHGVSYTRNYGIEKATGKYIMFVDADDYLEDSWFEMVSEDLYSENEIVYYQNKNFETGDKNTVIEKIMGMSGDSNGFAAPFSKLFLREKIYNIRFVENLINGEDMLFNLEMILNCDKFKIVSKSFYNYIIYQGSTMQSFKPKIFESDRMFHKRLEEVLHCSGLENEFIKRIKLHCLRSAVLVLNNRISFIPKWKDAKKKYEELNNEPYKSFLKHMNLKLKEKADIILLLSKMHLYFISYFVLRRSNVRKFASGNKEVCVKI